MEIGDHLCLKMAGLCLEVCRGVLDFIVGEALCESQTS